MISDELTTLVARAEKRIESQILYIESVRDDATAHKLAKVHLAKMLRGLKRLESYKAQY
jgi:hypothetical protein